MDNQKKKNVMGYTVIMDGLQVRVTGAPWYDFKKEFENEKEAQIFFEGLNYVSYSSHSGPGPFQHGSWIVGRASRLPSAIWRMAYRKTSSANYQNGHGIFSSLVDLGTCVESMSSSVQEDVTIEKVWTNPHEYQTYEVITGFNEKFADYLISDPQPIRQLNWRSF